MNAREKLDEFAEINGMNKNQLIGWSIAADFAEWYAEQVKNCSIPDVGRTLVCECLMPSIVGTPTNKNCMGCGKPFKAN